MWSWCEQLFSERITINCVRGGVRSTTMDSAAVNRWSSKVSRSTGAGRVDARALGFFQPEEAAPIIVWLASGQASEFTGFYIGIDGPKLSIWQPKLPDCSLYNFPRWSAEEIDVALAPALRLRGGRVSPTDLLTTTYNNTVGSVRL